MVYGAQYQREMTIMIAKLKGISRQQLGDSQGDQSHRTKGR
jgi:hypothetical protein